MTKKLFIILMMFLFTLAVFAETAGQSELTSPPNKTGKILLDTIISGFKAAAISGDGGYKTVDELLQLSMVRLRKAKRENTLDSVFYRRYKRILEILKLAIMDFKYDREGILSDFIARQMQSFVYDITGESKDLARTKSRGLGSIAQAVSFELLNLHIYLDTKSNRPELVKKYFKVPPPPPPSKKKKN
ncbi:MAG: hypothetical protein KAT17_06940 [Candidatus Aminicenantes bacterium]|nr:hypothetical protein [Candidatus Aminicenantes bacterium]